MVVLRVIPKPCHRLEKTPVRLKLLHSAALMAVDGLLLIYSALMVPMQVLQRCFRA